MKNKTKKKFDCVVMKHVAQAIIRHEVRGMTREQEVAYFRAGEEDFRRRLVAARRRNRHLSTSM